MSIQPAALAVQWETMISVIAVKSHCAAPRTRNAKVLHRWLQKQAANFIYFSRQRDRSVGKNNRWNGLSCSTSLQPANLHCARSADTLKELLRITGEKGINDIPDTTAVPQVLMNLAKALSIRGTLALVGVARPSTEAPFEIGESLVRGWTFKIIVQGSSVPQDFIPRLVSLWRQGRFPADKLTKAYKFEDTNKVFEDSAPGATVKPAIVF